MLKSYFKTIWRSVVKDIRFSCLNLIGLSSGLACVILIYLWVNEELNVDRFNEKDKHLYQVLHTDGTDTRENTPGYLAYALRDEVPEVEYAASVIPSTWFSNNGLFSFKETNIRAGAEFVSKDYFDVFTINFIEGNKSQLFSNKHAVAISKDLALKLFHTSNVVGKTVTWDQEGFNDDYVIAGVFEKFPSNSTTQFDAIFNYDLFLEKNPKLQQWTNSDPSTFLILRKGVDINRFNKKFTNFIKNKNEKSTSTLFVQRFSDRYLHGKYENGVPVGGRISYINLLTIIAIFILVIACINFMNLSTARALKRAKEVGIRKVMGAGRGFLVLQYLGESVLVSFLSLLIAIVIVLALLPSFQTITERQISFQFDSRFFISLLIITLTTGILAGSYPAVYLSGFNPMKVFSGKLKASHNDTWIRKGLVIFQLVVSNVLIVSVLVVYQQMNFVQKTNVGYNRDHVIYFEQGGKLSDDKNYYKEGGAYEKGLEAFIQRIKNIPGVVNASNFRHSIVNRNGGTTAVTWPGKSPNDQTQFTDIAAGYDFIETLDIQLIEGRSFSRNFGSEKSTVVFNEAAIQAMGIKNPIGRTVNIWGEDRQIIGVVKNFHFESLYNGIKPCFFDFSLNRRVSKIMVRIKAGTEQTTIAKLREFYKEFTGEPFEYKFLDEDYRALYASELKVVVLSRYFAGIAILISCLGLFGLAAFTAEKRKKEIGIRKVIGASVQNMVGMLSADFLKLVVIALAIALPLSWWINNNWLQSFAYRINITPALFVIACFAIIVITFLTVGFQTIKAASANPVKNLRTE
jgi:putative ABC transport system permease protein